MEKKIKIEFDEFKIFNNNRFNYLKSNFLLNKNFSTYHEFFERSFVEPCISSGIYTKLKFHKVKNYLNMKNDFLIGNNLNALNRCKYAKEFFSLYEKSGEKVFFKKKMFKSTKYYHDLYFKLNKIETRNSLKKVLINYKNNRVILERIKEYIVMYKVMKKNNSLLPKIKNEKIKKECFYPSDFPWAIKYSNYIRHRDGSHRRSIAFFLGWKTLPTLEFQFDLIEKNFLKKYSNLLYQYFPIYKKIINERTK